MSQSQPKSQPISNSTSDMRDGEWVLRLPRQAACVLLGVTLVLSQCIPTDTVLGVANSDTILFMLLCFSIGILVALNEALRVWRSSTSIAPWRPNSFVIACVLFIAWLWISASLQAGHQNQRFAFNGCWQWTAQIVLMLSIARLCRSATHIKTILSLMLALVAGTLAFALYQYFISMPRERSRFALDPASILSEVGIEMGSAEAMLYANRLASPEPLGPFALTNSFAGYLIVWLIILIGTWFVRKSSRVDIQERHSPTVWQVIVIICASAMLLLTNSRTAWLSFLLGMIGLFAIEPILRTRVLELAKRYRTLFALLGLLLIGLVIAGISIRPTIVSNGWKSLTYRFEYWQGAFRIVNAAPFIGDGVCNFQTSYNTVKPMTASESPADPHNFVLETLCAGGYPLLAVLLAALSSCIVAWMREGPRSNSALLFGGSDRPTTGSSRYEKSTLIGALIAGTGLMLVLVSMSGSDYTISITCMIVVSVVSVVWLRESILTQTLIHHPTILSVAISALLVHLLASGGWMLPGVMNSGCVLAGIVLSVGFSPCETQGSQGEAASKRNRLWVSTQLCFAFLVATGFGVTTLRPTMIKTDMVNSIQIDPNQNLDANQCLALMSSDAVDPELCRLAAMPCIRALAKTGLSASSRSEWNQVFDLVCRSRLERDPKNWIGASECARWNAMIADSMLRSAELSSSEHDEVKTKIGRADTLFRKAANLYPNSVATQLQAAVGAAWAGQFDSIATFVNRAQEIDQSTPHLDRKINQAVVFFPIALEKIGHSLGFAARNNLEPGMAKGEPVAQWLRMQSQAK